MNPQEQILAPAMVKAISKPPGLKLLLAGAARMGDLLFAFPAINYLLHCGMVRDLSVLCHGYAAPLLAGLSGKAAYMALPNHSWNFLDRWRMINSIKRKHFDAAIVFDGKRSVRKLLSKSRIPTILIEQRTGENKVRQHLHSVIQAFPKAGLSAEAIPSIPNLQIPIEALSWANARIAHIERPIIAFHVGCQRISRKSPSFEDVNRTATKVWLVERFLELGQMIIHRLGAAVLMVGAGKNERVLADEFVTRLGPKCYNAVDWGDSMQTAALLKQTDALAASDGGVLHLATAVGSKAVGIWGPTPIGIFAPIAEPGRVKIVRKDVHCSPCKKRSCDDKICLSSISAREVFDTLVALIATDEQDWAHFSS